MFRNKEDFWLHRRHAAAQVAAGRKVDGLIPEGVIGIFH